MPGVPAAVGSRMRPGVLAMALLLAPAGGGRRVAQRQVAHAPRDTVVVELTDELTYVPDTVRIAVAGTVTWRNTSMLVHTVTADPSKATLPGSAGLPEGVQPFDSGKLAPDAEFSHTFTVPGVYRYFCIPHEAAEMRGVVIVRMPP
jgi:plastocyanin